MDTTEKLLRAFIFRLALLLLAVLAARHFGDQAQRAIAGAPATIAAFDASIDGSSGSSLANVGLQD